MENNEKFATYFRFTGRQIYTFYQTVRDKETGKPVRDKLNRSLVILSVAPSNREKENYNYLSTYLAVEVLEFLKSIGFNFKEWEPNKDLGVFFGNVKLSMSFGKDFRTFFTVDDLDIYYTDRKTGEKMVLKNACYHLRVAKDAKPEKFVKKEQVENKTEPTKVEAPEVDTFEMDDADLPF